MYLIDLLKAFPRLVWWPKPAQPAKKRKPAVKKPVAEWGDYVPPRWKSKHYRRTHFVISFADDETFGVSCPSDRRKPANGLVAARVAASFYRNRKSAAWANAKGLSGEARNRERDRYERKLVVPAVKSIRVFDDAGAMFAALPARAA